MATNSIITKVTGTDTSTNRIASTFYGTCSTGASTAAKAVTLSDSCVFNDSCLVTGVTIHVKFTNSNTNATPTLKVGTATAKQIMAYGTTATASWYAGSVVSFTYDGTYWIMNDYKIDTDTKVTQTATSTNSTYEVLFSNSANNTTETAGARKNNNLTFNPSSGTLDCTATGTNLKSAIRSDVRVELTQAQYDALVTAGTVDPNIIYLITDTSTVMSATDVSYDNAGSGLSATNVQGAIDELCCYSTSERIIGSWTDGKPLYESIVSYSQTNISSTKNISISSLGANFAFIVQGIIKDSGGNVMSFPYFSSSDDTANYGAYINSSCTTLTVQVGSYWSTHASSGQFIIHYTKS